MISVQAKTVAGSLVLLIALSTVFFRYVEGWSWIDAYFFTVVTLSTVGYGVPVPATVVGKIATTVLIFVGLGLFALAIQLFTRYHVERRDSRSESLIWRLSHRWWQETPPAQDPPGDDDDTPPARPRR